jgi:capsule biosynthesis phosphatase
MKRLIVDMDDTISFTQEGKYEVAKPNNDLILKLKSYQENGFEIVIFSSRNMRTYDKNIGKINIHTLPVIINWLNEFNVPYDEVYVGKPWCGFDGFYIDDKAIRPSEFLKYNYDEIIDLLSKEKQV